MEKINTHNWFCLVENNLGKALVLATFIKILIIFFFYQHVIEYENGIPRIASGFAWKELVENIHQGKYELTAQYSLAKHYDFKSKTARPPVYTFFLYFATFLKGYAAIVVVVFQSLVTSAIAYFGYKLVLKPDRSNSGLAILCLGILFIFPMNFLKSGVIDDAPLALLFLLISLFSLRRHAIEKNNSFLIVMAGVFLGLSTLTRLTALFVVIGIIPYLLLSKHISLKGVIYFAMAYGLTLSPWLIRNYFLFGEIVISTGGNRFLLFTQSDLFIKNFPHYSMDKIEYDYFIREYEKLRYINELGEVEKDREFFRLALKEAKENPKKYLTSLLVKMKIFLPFKYYPDRGNIIKDIGYALPYFIALILFFISIIKYQLNFTSILIIISIMMLSSIAILFVLMSRHLYPIICLLFIFSFSQFSLERRKFNIASL